MARKRGTRDPRHSKTFGRTPHVGRRYVVDGKVRIEWREDGRRRSRTVGKNDAATRAAADAELERILAQQRGPTLVEEPAGAADPGGSTGTPDPIELLRAWLVAALDAADRLAAWIDEVVGAGSGDR